MDTPVIVSAVPSIREQPFVVLHGDHPDLSAAFSPADWDHLERLFARLPWQSQARGDVAEHSLEVAMLVTNRPRPAEVAGVAAELVAFLAGTPRMHLFRRLFGRASALHLRRAQVNRMNVGSYNRFHRDTDDDPDYVIGALLYPSDPADYDGGELCFEDTAPFKPPRRSLVAFRADLGHALTPISRARVPRLSIVLLFGEHAADNRRFAAAWT